MATASQVARELPPEIMAKLSGWHTLTNEVLDLLNTDDLSAAYEVVGRVLAQAQPVTSAWPAEMPAMVVQGKKELLLPPREAKALEALGATSP